MEIELQNTTLHRKLISQTYTLDIEGVIINATHIFEYDEIGDYYYEDILYDVEVDEETQEEVREFISNL